MLTLEQIIIFVLSIVALVFSADMVLKSISRYARTIGISDFLIGLIVVSIGTSLPELTTAIMGSVSRLTHIVLGNVIGANIIDITLVMGLMAIVAKKLKVQSGILGKRIILTMVIVSLPLLLSLDGRLSRFDGILMLVAYFIYLFILVIKSSKFELGKIKKDVPLKAIYKDMIIFIIFLPLLLLSAYFVVQHAKIVAVGIGISDYIIGLTIVAIGTTLPELVVGLSSIHRKKIDIGISDLMGSVIVNSSMVLGIASILNPINITVNLFATSAAFMITTVFIGLIFLREKEVTWREGVALLLLYFTFLISQGIFL